MGLWIGIIALFNSVRINEPSTKTSINLLIANRFFVSKCLIESRAFHPFNPHNPTLHVAFHNCHVEWLSTVNLPINREKAMTYGPLQRWYRINIPSCCSSCLYVKAQYKGNVHTRCHFGREESTWWSDVKDAHGWMWRVSKYLNPSLKPLSHLREGPALISSLGLV